jgi:hypothetical protein
MTSGAVPSPMRRAILAGLAAWGTLGASPAARAKDELDVPGFQVSAAERLLFLRAHLSNIRPPCLLRYRYRRESRTDGRIDDQASLLLTSGATAGCCAVHVDYLSGERALRLPDIPDARANPVVLYFLEHQMRQLQQRTGGPVGHFRGRTRVALAESATVSEGTLRYGEEDVQSHTVRVAPYLDDPYRNRFGAEAATEYSFVLADAVPGVFHQLRASSPEHNETVTFEAAQAPADTKG